MKLFLFWLLCLALFSLPSALYAADSPPTSLPAKAGERFKIGLALSGGGARGLAHIGVLLGLEQLRIPVDYIAGTSMGSIVGGLYSMGLTGDRLDEVAKYELHWKQLFDNQVDRSDLPYRAKQNQQRFLGLELGFNEAGLSAPAGFIDAQELLSELTKLTQGLHAEFSSLPIPFKAVATDLNEATPYLLERGDLAMALRASMAVPFAFAPVEIDGRLLVDGGILNNIPVDVVRNMGAELVIAVNIETPLTQLESNSSFISITEQTIYAALVRNSQEALQKADLVLMPDLTGFTSTDFDKTAALIDAGYQAVMDKAKLLSFLSLSEAEYSAHLAQRQARRLHTPTLLTPAFIDFTGYQRTNPKLLQEQVKDLLQQPIAIDQLQTAATKLMSLRDLEQVTYQVVERDGEEGVVFNVQEKTWGPHYLQFGLNATTTFDDKAEFTLLFHHELLNIGSLGAEWINELTVGTDYQLSTEYYQPLNVDQRYFLAPYAKVGRYFSDVYQDQRNIGEYDLRRLQLGIDFGINISNAAQLRTGFRYQDVNARLRVGVPDDEQLAIGTREEGAWQIRFDYDTLDHRIFATHGSYLSLQGNVYAEQLGAEENYQKIVAYGRHHIPLNSRVVLMTDVMFGSFLHSTSPPYEDFSVGGSDALGGFSRTEVGGSHALVMRVGTILNSPTLNKYWPAGQVRLLTMLHAGNAWDEFNQIGIGNLHYGATASLLWNTRLGAMLAGVGYTREGDLRFFLNLGNLYLRGFDFDE